MCVCVCVLDLCYCININVHVRPCVYAYNALYILHNCVQFSEDTVGVKLRRINQIHYFIIIFVLTVFKKDSFIAEITSGTIKYT